MAKLRHSMRKAALRSSCSRYSKALVMSRWSILPLICSFWMGKICANSDSAPGANSWLSCLKKLLRTSGFSGELRGSKDELLRVAQEFGLEGLVAKRPNSVYESGRRSGAWVKFKITKSQEFAIGGYTLPQGNRKYFGSLLVRYRSPDGLIFAGRVGAGFSEKLLANLYTKFQRLRVSSCPFVNLPEKSKGRWGLG